MIQNLQSPIFETLCKFMLDIEINFNTGSALFCMLIDLNHSVSNFTCIALLLLLIYKYVEKPPPDLEYEFYISFQLSSLQ